MHRQPNMQLAQAGHCDIASTRRAWREYVENGRSSEGLVRPHVTQAWERSRAGGCNPRLMKADLLDAGGTKRLLETEEDLIQAARPFLRTLSEAAGDHRHAVMLGDRTGRVLDTLGDEASISGPEAVPGPGALLNESSAGANGIGTPLARDGYVELVGPEHFIEGFHPFTCQGIPLRDAFGEIAGVLSASVRRQATANRVRDVLFCATEGLECQLIHEWLLGWVKSVGVPQARWADKLRQDLVQTFASARLEFELAARDIARGGSTDDVIGKIRAELRRFRRLADTWRDLVEHRHRGDEELWLADVTSSVFDLFATEARFARVELTVSESPRVRVLDDRTGLARRLLGVLLDAMQAAGAGGRVSAEITRDDDRSVATLLLRVDSADATSVASFGLVSKLLH